MVITRAIPLLDSEIKLAGENEEQVKAQKETFNIGKEERRWYLFPILLGQPPTPRKGGSLTPKPTHCARLPAGPVFLPRSPCPPRGVRELRARCTGEAGHRHHPRFCRHLTPAEGAPRAHVHLIGRRTIFKSPNVPLNSVCSLGAQIQETTRFQSRGAGSKKKALFPLLTPATHTKCREQDRPDNQVQ